MNDKDLNELIESIEESQIECPNLDCCEYNKYAQCMNHSYAICKTFEDWYQRKQDGKLR